MAQRLREKEILGEGLQRPSEYGWMEERFREILRASQSQRRLFLKWDCHVAPTKPYLQFSTKGLIQYIYLLTPGSPQNQGLQRFGCRGKCTCGKILAGQPQENCEFFSCYCVSPFRLGTLL